MKIFYAVQATGNGHIARAKELIPFLSKYGQVDVFLSGANSSLNPGFEVRYKSKGLCFFYTKNGGINYAKTLQHFNPMRVWNEAKSLPIERYDIVINDFESITALAARIKKVSTIGVGHQYSFLSDKTPRPDKKEILGELVLKNYARAQKYIGLHFRKYDENIYPAVVKAQIKNAMPKKLGHYTVYLPQYSDMVLWHVFSKFSDCRFVLFSPFTKVKYERDNILFHPIDNKEFARSVINADGIITGAGFETPAEALYMNKKILCVPIKGQYEQYCNAAALKAMGVTVTYDLDAHFDHVFRTWLQQEPLVVHLQAMDNEALALAILKAKYESSSNMDALGVDVEYLSTLLKSGTIFSPAYK